MSDPTPYRELLLGCGHSREKRLHPVAGHETWSNLVTVDANSDVHPDVVTDLNGRPEWEFEGGNIRPGLLATRGLFEQPLYFKDRRFRFAENSFDEIHAYEVLEHLGSQGEPVSFFGLFSEIYRVLTPGGWFCATVPSRFSGWLWGDPSHTRVICAESLIFLDQSEYHRQLDGEHPTSMSDFRYLYQADFDVSKGFRQDNKRHFMFTIQAVKPSRWGTFK